MYYDDVTLIKNPQLIIWKYIKYEFWLDFIPIIPFSFISEELVVFRLVRLFNWISYIIQIDHMIEVIILRLVNAKKTTINAIQKLVQFFLYFSFLVHFFTWIWIRLGIKNEDNGWIANNSTLVNANDSVDLYIVAFYYIVTTFAMIGYGDITGHSNDEYLLAWTVEFLGMWLFGYIAGNVSDFLKSADSSASLIALQVSIFQWR